MRAFTSACVLALVRTVGAALLCAAATAGAAPAPSVPVTDTHHGVTVSDPFRNLEDLAQPDTRAWLLAEGERAAATLARIQGRDALRERLTELNRSTGDQVRQIRRRAGGRIFYLKRAAGEAQFKLMVRHGLQGAERVLVDPQALQRADGQPHAVNYFNPSWGGRTLAYGLSAGGSENASLHLMDVASGRALRAPIDRVQQHELNWTPDNRWLSFTRLRALPPGTPPQETYLDTTLFLLDRQHPQREPRALFGPLVNPELKLDRLDVGEVIFTPGSRWMLARTTDTTVPEGRLFLAPLAELQRRPIRWRAVSTAADRITHAALRGDTLYLHTHADAPRGRVLALPATAPRLADARVAVPEPARGVLRSFELGRRALYVELLQGFGTRVLRHRGDGGGDGADPFPGVVGSTYAIVDPQAGDDELWAATSTWTEPSRVLAAGRDGGVRDTGLRRQPLPAGVPELQVTETEVDSHDGVRVPLAVLHRKGLALDGRNPTLLDGYGAYGLTTQAWFDPRRYAWLERGGVLAYVNPRGSGAYGDAWHRAGFKASKPNTWKDGIAAARALVARGYASPATLAVTGGSAGGIFAGRALTEAPELFAAAVLHVPVLDAVRFETTANGATNVSEFGSVKLESEFRALLEMSPYHQIRDGVAYPAVLLAHGLNDPRVDPWHSAKGAARLQQATASGKPVLLRLDARAGHGIGSTADQAAALSADVYAFLLWQFGVAALQP